MLSTSTTTTTLLPQELITNLHYQRRWLLQSNFYHPQPTPPDVKPDPSTHPGFDTNLAMVLAVLLCALVCSLCVNSLIRCVLKCSSFIIREPNYYINRTQLPGIDVGLDKRALKTFPIVKYSKDFKIENVCAICLSDFKKAEKLRILPRCNHGFHVKCVDKWLKSHSSCPTCRQSLIDTCHKITSDHDIHQQVQVASSSSTISSVAGTGDQLISVSVVPLEREDLVRNYRG